MKIAKVEVFPLAVPVEGLTQAPISLPHADVLKDVVFKAYRATLVRVTADDGTYGIGECMTRLAPRAIAAIVEEIAPVVVGRDPWDVEVIWELMYGVMMNRGHNRGFFMEAVSGIDVAIWDLKGKAAGRPVCQLLGGCHRKRLNVYASSLRFRPLEVVAEETRRLIDSGFKAIKVKIGRGRDKAREDMEFIRAVRKIAGDGVTLMADANCGYDFNAAMEVGKCLQDEGYAWFEEPLTPDDLVGYTKLADRLDIPVAGGEALFSKYDFNLWLREGGLDIVQPNVGRAGGFTECRRIAALAQAYHIPYAPHTGSSSQVCIAASVQMAAALPNFLIFEHMVSDWSRTKPNPLRHYLLADPVEVFEENELVVPLRPGIGARVREEVLAECAG